MNGSEVSRRKDMPLSKIYETLARLEAKGAVLVNHSEPVRYTPLPPKDVLTVLKDKFSADLSNAQEELADLPENREPGLVSTQPRCNCAGFNPADQRGEALSMCWGMG